MDKKRLALPIAGSIGLLLLILWSGGFFITGRIEPGTAEPARLSENPLGAEAVARLAPVTDWYEAVGTVRPRTETRIEAQVSARVEEVRVTAGDKVAKGDVLIALDSRQLDSQLAQAQQGAMAAAAALEQARQTIKAGQAAHDQASSQYQRIMALYAKGAVTSQEKDAAQAGYLQTQAQLEQARDGLAGAEASLRQANKRVEEADIALDHATIRAHEDGEISKRDVEPGDQAFPGKTLLLLQASGAMRLEALAPEGLVGRTTPGATLPVVVNALDLTVQGVVEEVAPSADPRTRTFLVKVGLPPHAGLYPGMFGRLLVPLGERNAVLAPRQAVRRVGQLETVWVRDAGRWRKVFVKTGPERDGDVEILAGLTGGETVAVPAALTDTGAPAPVPAGGSND